MLLFSCRISTGEAKGLTVGEQIKRIRKEKGLTQREVCERMGKTPSFIGQYENGARLPKYDTLKEIAKALGVRVRVLLEPLSNESDFIEHPEQFPFEYVNELISDMKSEAEEQKKSEPIYKLTEKNISKIESAMHRLNAWGQFLAVQRIEELTEVPRYQRHPEIPTANATPPDGKEPSQE